jgi:hypothetical protein
MKKKLTTGLLALLATNCMAFDAVLDSTVTITQPTPPPIVVERVRIGKITLDLDALQHSPTNCAISVPYRWINEAGKTTRTGEARISMSDMVAMLGTAGASNEVSRLLGLVDQVVKSVVK